MSTTRKAIALHLAVIAALFALQFVLPPYHHTNVARILVLAVYALGFNILLGYTGLMSLGHAMFFAAGMYGAGLTIYYLGVGAPLGFLVGILSGLVLSILFGLLALRTSGVAFLIVSMMVAQAIYLCTLYFNEITLGDQGFIVKAKELAGIGFHEPAMKYNGALALFAAGLLFCLALRLSPIGRVLIAIRENEERTRLLGYNSFLYKLLAVTVSGTLSAAAGAAYAILFSYVGSTFASILFSIYPLLWTLLGGAGTLLGPLLGTGMMFYLVDVASGWTSAYLLVVGVALVALVLWFPLGFLGWVRARWATWLP
ncbi:MAG TPA: branched-chain amino acid ABC transporter permease [Burkholderiales bacterium]|nr:branched-chain amino acid ABC transporter permease [Burkholderiales bacterium]